MRELKPFEIAAVKRQFQNSLPTLKKIEALDEKIARLQEEKDTLVDFLKGGEQGIMRLTGGYMSTELIKCEYVPQYNEDNSPKVDKDGRQLKKRVLTYIPPVEVPETTGNPGSDFDLDKETLIETVTEEVEPVESDVNPFNV